MRRWLMAALLLAGCAGGEAPPQLAGPIGAVQGREQLHWVPSAGVLLMLRLCLPAAEAGPLVVINHGSPADSARRPGMVPAACGSEAVSWFTGRGQVVALPMRRGFGKSGGAFAESSRLFAESSDPCDRAGYAGGGLEAARDIQATIDYARALPQVAAARPVVVVGQSAGGWASLALASRNPPGVAAIVNMAGGRGGWFRGVPNSNCRPDQLARAAGTFGQTARLPVLSIYTANDSFFAPAIARDIQAQYQAAGGVMEVRNLPAFGSDGHGLFFARGGSAVWGPEVAAFLAAQGQ